MIKYLDMQGAVKSRVLLSTLSVVVVIVGTIFAVKFAKGYRPDIESGGFKATGILNAESYPESAKVYVNGQYKTITKDRMNLAPGQYEVEIKLDGFVPWKKNITIEPETVSTTTAWLFPSVPSLKAITSTGASNPVTSPDGTKVAFIKIEKSSANLYTLDLNETAFGFIIRDPKLLSSNLTTPTTIEWSPDSRQILTTASTSATLIDTSGQQKSVLDTKVLKQQWELTATQKASDQFANLPTKLQEIFATAAADIVWSPKEDKILYTATASAVIAEKIIPPLPGSSTQLQERTLVPGHVYVYDLEEDRNFRVDQVTPTTPTPIPTLKPKNPKSTTTAIKVSNADMSISNKNSGWQWFPTSNHLIKAVNGTITIMEYDAQNATVVYAGPMEGTFLAPYPSTKQVLILTNLNPTLSLTPNLYAVSLR